MDELGLNKLFAGILVAGLMLMAGIKLADVLVPHSELTQNAYVIEVPEGGTAVAEAPKATGPEPIFALLASADAIAGEKLGVAPEGFTGLVVGEQEPASAPGVDAAMAARGMSGWWVGQEIAVEAGNRDAMTIRTPNGALRVDADMPARWQRANLALAVGAAERTLGRGVDLPALMRALGAIENPGRLQVVPGAPVVVLDGAHNPAGARALADALPLLLGDVRPIAVMGMMADKDAQGILDPLAPLLARVCVTRASTGRAVRPELLVGMLRDRGVQAEVVPGPARALQRARALAGPEGAVLVAGSLHLLADLAPVALGQSGTLAAAPGPDGPLADVWRLDDFRK